MININPAHKGKLHEALGIPEGSPIPVRKLMKAKASKNVKLREMATFAKNARSWGK